MKMFAIFLKFLGKLPENTDKNGALRCLILKNWCPMWGESHEDLFLEIIPKMMKYSHRELPEKFSSKFGEIRAKIFRTPKTLSAPTSMCLCVGKISCYTIVKLVQFQVFQHHSK